MNEITTMFEGNKIRVIDKEDGTWFVAKDVSEFFGDSNYKRSLRGLDDDERGVTHMNTPGGMQDVNVINESGLYHLLFNMTPQKAPGTEKEYVKKRIEKITKFRRWVTHDVIPTIRRTGSYSVAPKPEPKPSLPLDEELKGYIRDLLSASTNFARQCSRLSERNSYLEQFAPKADYGDENILGQPRYQKRRGYYVANRGADVCKRDPDKYGYQQDLFYDRLPQILTETFNQAVKRLCIED
jgi:prophage antirepressor-like protein